MLEEAQLRSVNIFYNCKITATAQYVFTFLHNRSFGAFPTYNYKAYEISA